MITLDTHLDPTDATFTSNRRRMEQLVAELRERLSRAREGGGAKYLDRHREQGKEGEDHQKNDAVALGRAGGWQLRIFHGGLLVFRRVGRA